MIKDGIGFLAASTLVFGAAVGSAQSAPATVYLSGETLRHIATDGQTNVISMSNSGSRLIVKDTAGLTAGEGCTQSNATTVSCTLPNTFVLDLKDGDDIVTNGSNVRLFVYGGPGNDVLNGGTPNEGLFGDEGNDVVNGNGGSDFLNGGTGNDVIAGGAGDDQLDDPEGNDTINGDAGNDTIFSLDGVKDVINCGSGSDSYGLDANDVRSGCETSLN